MTEQLNKKKITFFLPRLHNNLRPIIDTLIELNFEVTVLVLREGRIENHSKINYVKLKKMTILKKKYFDTENIKKVEFPSVTQVYRHLKDNKPDYMIIRNDFTLSYIPVLILGIFHQSKILLYNQYPKNNSSFFQFMYNQFFYKILRLRTISPVLNRTSIVQSESSSESLEQYRLRLINDLNYDESKNASVWVPFASNIKPTHHFNNLNIIRIVTVGKFQKRKNLDKVILLLENFAKSKEIAIELTIVGELVDSEKNYFSYLEMLKYNLSNYINVNILFNLNHIEVTKIYEQSNIFILLSEREVASVSQVEAFLSGCSIIIFFDNGNLDFLPLNPLFQIVNSLRDIDKSLDIILNTPQTKPSVLSYSSIYYELCCGINGVNRILKLF
jgi:hypothetical protein